MFGHTFILPFMLTLDMNSTKGKAMMSTRSKSKGIDNDVVGNRMVGEGKGVKILTSSGVRGDGAACKVSDDLILERCWQACLER